MPETISMATISHRLDRMTRQASEPVIWKPAEDGCAASGAGSIGACCGSGRGKRMGVVVGNVVIAKSSLTSAPRQHG
jgi:hypothetical protein